MRIAECGLQRAQGSFELFLCDGEGGGEGDDVAVLAGGQEDESTPQHVFDNGENSRSFGLIECQSGHEAHAHKPRAADGEAFAQFFQLLSA